MTSANRSDSGAVRDEAYVYDDNGNRVGNQTIFGSTQAYDSVAGTNNLLLNDGTFEYWYDPEQNRTYRIKSSNDNVCNYAHIWDWSMKGSPGLGKKLVSKSISPQTGGLP